MRMRKKVGEVYQGIFGWRLFLESEQFPFSVGS